MRIRFFSCRLLASSVLVAALVLTGCGTQRKNIFARSYHNTVAFFNGYYHANLNYRKGLKVVEKGQEVPTDGFMPLLSTTDASSAQSAYIYFDTAIVKNDYLIYKHPNCGRVDDARFLTGRCHFYKRNFSNALQNFNYILFAFPESDLIPEVTLWAAKTYFVTGNEFRANALLNDLPDGLEMDRQTEVEIAEMRATLALDEARYSDALAVLQDHLEEVKDRKRKARWNFLMGQLYEELEDYDRAYGAYNTAARLNVSNEMTFNARLNMAGLFAQSDNLSPEKLSKVRNSLDRLADDGKYTAFRDQIFYQRGLLEIRQGNLEEGLAYLKQSLQVSQSNTRQQVLSYSKVGELYFEEFREFKTAQAYYDSAAQRVTPEMAEYDRITALSEKLNDYIVYRKDLALQDSLLHLASLPQAEQLAAAERAVRAEEEAARRREEEEKRRQAELQRQAQFDAQNQSDFNTSGGGSFYFADPTQVARGTAEFQRVWGNRPNEDDWRRRTKQAVFASAEREAEQADAVNPDESREEKVQRYANRIPSSPSALDSTRLVIQEALFGIGQLYVKVFEVPDTALFYFKQLTTRFPEAEMAPKAYYAQYTTYRTMPNPQEANRTRQLILDRYARSLYARLLRNEDVSAEFAGDAQAFNEALSTLRGLYESGDCEAVVNFGGFLVQKYGTHPQGNKLQYMQGSCYGQLGQTDSMKAVYERMILAYPDTELADIARRSLALLANPDAQLVANRPRSEDGTPENDPLEDPESRVYGFEVEQGAEEPVFAVLTIARSAIKSAELNELMSDFHRELFPNDNLRASVLTYRTEEEESWLVYVAQFKDFPTANGYREVAKTYDRLTKLMTDEDGDVLLMTPTNFRKVFVERRAADYRVFQKMYFKQLLANGTRAGGDSR